MFTETWLNSNILDSELCLNDYNIFRHDRDNETSKLKKGGGVLIAVDKSIECSELKVDDSSLEQKIIKISINKVNFICCVIYIRPAYSISDYFHHTKIISDLSNKFPDYNFIIAGDFNIPKISWSNNPVKFKVIDYVPPLKINCAKLLCDTFSSMDISQIFPLHKIKNYSLDLFFAPTQLVSLEDLDEPLLRCDSHHVPCYFKIDIPVFEVGDTSVHRNFYKADFISINKTLMETNWDDVLDSVDINVNVDKFYHILHGVIDSHVPIKITKTNSFPVWFNSDLIKLISVKKRAHSVYKFTKEDCDFIYFKMIRARCIRLSRSLYREFIETTERNINTNSKSFWSYIKKLSSNFSIPSFTRYKDKNSNNISDTTKLFSEYFSNVYSTDTLDPPPLLPNPTLLSDIIISPLKIDLVVSEMKTSTSHGPDLIPSLFIKNCWQQLRSPIIKIFSDSINSGIFPDKWKSVYIQPIFKQGSKSDVSNYRPISIINYFAKILDSIVNDELYNSISIKLITNQHGFIKNKSTLSNLLCFSNYIYDAFSRKSQVDAIFMDFSKAFDKVNHNVLINKLYNMGVHGNILAWISSYLSNRTQSVRIGSTVSDSVLIPSGVPQGSHLGPLLFLIYINDLSNSLIYSNFLLYADDLKIFSEIKSPLDSSNLQKDIDATLQWSLKNGLDLNIKKCHSMTFSRHSSQFEFLYMIDSQYLSRVDSVKDLGIILDSSLDFKLHLDFIISKCMRLLGFIKRSTFHFKNWKSIYTLYNTLVLPNLIYCCQLWRPSLIIDKYNLDSIQRYFLRFISFKTPFPVSKFDHDFTRVINFIHISPLDKLFDYYDSCLAYKIVYNLINETCLSNLFKPRVLPYNLRNPRTFTESKSLNNFEFNSYPARLIRIWNLIPPDVKSCPIGHFKNQSREFFLSL